MPFSIAMFFCQKMLASFSTSHFDQMGDPEQE